jgi:hypothetical protein
MKDIFYIIGSNIRVDGDTSMNTHLKLNSIVVDLFKNVLNA